MALLIHNDKEILVKDGERIVKPCEEIGLVFGCREGLCEVCRVRVLEGAEFLNELTENEKEMGIKLPLRLACQCLTKGGKIVVVQDNGLPTAEDRGSDRSGHQNI